jgi:xylose dehydrogenase (NAD/NADP)
MREKINWGILGCAGIAERALVPAIKESRTGTLFGIASRDADKAAGWVQKHGFEKSYGSYGELVDDADVDAIYNPLPNHLHAEWSIRAARAGKHVLCEKPMAMNAGEVRDMAAAAEAAGVLLMEAFMYKFHPQIEAALELLSRGEIGSVRSVHSSFTFRFEDDGVDYRWSPQMGGGALYDVGCYTISACRLVLGAEPLSVFARSVLHPKYGVDLSTHALLEFPGGRFAHCDCAFDAHFQSRLRVVGEGGMLTLDRAFSAKSHEVAVGIVKGDRRKDMPVPVANMYTLMVDHFGACVLGKKPPRYSVRDAERNMAVIDACFESARTNRPVSL